MIGTETNCFELQAVEDFQAKHGCFLPWTLSGNNQSAACPMDQSMSSPLKEYLCQAWPFSKACADQENKPSCSKNDPCSKILMSVTTTQTTKMSFFPKSVILEFLWKDQFITYMQEYYNYDLQSFIGEVGGTAGLFLGVSFLTSISDFFESILGNCI